MIHSLIFAAFRHARWERFWEGWEERFESEYPIYITPSNPAVIEEVEKVDLQDDMDDSQKATAIWFHIYNNIEYRLSREWKTPEQTLTEGRGDCEDVDFLFLSMAYSEGIGNMDLVIGNLVYNNGSFEAHTWIEREGRIIDPTGLPENVKRHTYEQERRFNLTIKKEDNKCQQTSRQVS